MSETIQVTCPVCQQTVKATPNGKGQAKMKPHWLPGVALNERTVLAGKSLACVGSVCSVAVKA